MTIKDAAASCMEYALGLNQALLNEPDAREQVNKLVHQWVIRAREEFGLGDGTLSGVVTTTMTALKEANNPLHQHWYATVLNAERRANEAAMNQAKRDCGSIINWAKGIVEGPDTCDMVELAIALMIVSGLRIGEVIHYVNTVYAALNHPKYTSVHRVIVDRLEKQGKSPKAMRVPIMVPALTFVHKFQLLRAQWSSPKLNSKKAEKINEAMPRLPVLEQWCVDYENHFRPVLATFSNARGIKATSHKLCYLHHAAMMQLTKARHGAIDGREFLHHAQIRTAYDNYDHLMIEMGDEHFDEDGDVLMEEEVAEEGVNDENNAEQPAAKRQRTMNDSNRSEPAASEAADSDESGQSRRTADSRDTVVRSRGPRERREFSGSSAATERMSMEQFCNAMNLIKDNTALPTESKAILMRLLKKGVDIVV
ncbi:hypothetical protein JKP88DRAFT_282682 [Tribonema minus]|uniref:Uncharacterized protein n=1 Tax=Tribonema minus TaxID=303371 RepID=A0A836C8M3_9STRA|nr:hypothetical protein JKP88DRAFT_282682 [Tribonema minus]